jgi:hypothetical protein
MSYNQIGRITPDLTDGNADWSASIKLLILLLCSKMAVRRRKEELLRDGRLKTV